VLFVFKDKCVLMWFAYIDMYIIQDIVFIIHQTTFKEQCPLLNHTIMAWLFENDKHAYIRGLL